MQSKCSPENAEIYTGLPSRPYFTTLTGHASEPGNACSELMVVIKWGAEHMNSKPYAQRAVIPLFSPFLHDLKHPLGLPVLGSMAEALITI